MNCWYEGRVSFARVIVLFPLVACISTNGASAQAIPLVRAYAESDLDCPGDRIRIEQELGGRFEAIGCGHKATYSAACEGVSCVVRGEGERAVPWRDRPDPSPQP